MIVICNSTPLVHLSACGQLELLHSLFSEILIPEEVYYEVVILGAGKPGAADVQAAPWIKRRRVVNTLALSLLRASLGAGEAACIVLASEQNADQLILDDRAGRAQAQSLGLKVTGTVGLLLAADGQGLLQFPKALDDLLATGFRLHPAERRRILEIWSKDGRPI